MIHESNHSIQDIRVGLLKDPTLMGNFALPPPINMGNILFVATSNMISSTKVNMDHSMVLPPSPLEIL